MRQDKGTGQSPRSAPIPTKEPPALTRVHKILIGVVVTGAVTIAGIGFAGSYAAVRELALQKGFGNFSYLLPVGIDAGIVVLLALDLLLTWIRIPFPLLRQTAWLLTAATIAFNGAAAWPDPLGVGMHAVIPVLFVVAVEAARHAIGRIADITADKHMEGVRLTRWLLSPVPTFLLWRRMKLWELRSYDQVIKLEQERLVYQARLHARFGRAWRRKAPVESLMPLRLARYGVPLRETAQAGLEAAGIPVPAELERLDAIGGREELPTTAATVPELESLPVDFDRAEHHRRDEALDTTEVEKTAGHPALETESDPKSMQPAHGPYEAYGPVPEESYSGGYDPSADPYGSGAVPVGAPSPVAAPTDVWRPRIVHARVNASEWDTEPLMDEGVGESPIGDEVPVPGQAGKSVPPSSDEGEVESVPEQEPDGLTGTALLEYRYLRLPPEQRALSAVKLSELLHEGTGYTAGTARKYLGDIIREHRGKFRD
ncbi:DUF2637 domain-containing protein [Streptomyces sp. NPDC016566]|uniref:DUF2637 domain-containing protein n=1 Tax=Streptomyces sp. NPDC016566 TaxID=3364967 RepID=UPI0036F59843